MTTAPKKEADNTSPRRGRPSRRADKRAKLVVGATQVFNTQGISATSVSDVAESIDLSRATAYYYVKNRSELVRLCYQQACDVAAEDLATAARKETGLERVLKYVNLALTPDRSPVAVMSEINSLPEAIATEIREANDRNVSGLIGFLQQGIADQSISVRDPTLAAQAIVGMLSWTQLLPQWSDPMRREALRERAATTMRELVSQGILRKSDYRFECPVGMDAYLPRLDDIFDRKKAAELKLERVLATASKLFNRNGIEATSLDEIASALGLTKGVIYHYLNDKRDLVRQCYERSFILYGRFVEDARAAGKSGLEAALINAHLNAQAQAGEVAPLMPQPGFEALPSDLRRQLQESARKQNRAVASLLKDGIREGLARPCDAGLVTHLFAGALGWIPKWKPPNDARSPREIADAMCELILHGIGANGSVRC